MCSFFEPTALYVCCMLIYFKPMNTLFSLHKSRCYIISSLLLVLFSFEAQAQLVRVIDNKGTMANVRNNQVTTALTAPTTPLEGDIWFDSTTAISKVWDGTIWKVVDPDVVTVANTAPTSPAPIEGDIWFNNTNPNTIFANVWNGTAWQPIQNSWLGNTTIHHTVTTVLAITEALHNNADIHIESTGDLSLTSTDVSDATNFYITNTTAADRTLSFTGFSAAYLRNGGPITDLSGGLTLKSNTRYLAHITENSGSFYFNATEAGGGTSGPISKVYSAEYAGAVFSADGTDNLGTMTAENTGATNSYMNYYQWSSTQSLTQDYDVVLRFTLPSDFKSWQSDAIQVDYVVSDAASATLYTFMYPEAGGSALATASGTATTWTQVPIASDTDLTSLTTPGETAVIILKLEASNDATVRIGDVTLNYVK